MIFESRYTIPFPREITTRFLKPISRSLSIVDPFEIRPRETFSICLQEEKGNFSFFRNWKIVTLILSDISDISERYTRLAKERKSSFVTRAFRFLSIPPFELFSLYILSLFPRDRTEIR